MKTNYITLKDINTEDDIIILQIKHEYKDKAVLLNVVSMAIKANKQQWGASNLVYINTLITALNKSKKIKLITPIVIDEIYL